MTTLARKILNNKNIEINYNFLENTAEQKNQEFDKERTVYIMQDGSAIWINSFNGKGLITNYGKNADYEKL